MKSRDLLQPAWPDSAIFAEWDSAAWRRQTKDYNRRHGVRQLRELRPVQDVWVTDMQCAAQLLSLGQRPRCYVVATPNGVVQRSRCHLVPFGASRAPRGGLCHPESKPATLLAPMVCRGLLFETSLAWTADRVRKL